MYFLHLINLHINTSEIKTVCYANYCGKVNLYKIYAETNNQLSPVHEFKLIY